MSKAPKEILDSGTTGCVSLIRFFSFFGGGGARWLAGMQTLRLQADDLLSEKVYT